MSKKIWVRHSVAAACLLVCLASVHGALAASNDTATGTFSAAVYDAATEAPLEGARVTVGDTTVTTNASGRTGEIDVEGSPYTVTVTLSPFEEYTKSFATEPGARIFAAIGLTRPSFGAVSITVVDASSSKPIAGALVEIRGSDTESSEFGAASFAEVRNGPVSVWASHADYESSSGQGVVVGGETLELRVEIGPRKEDVETLAAGLALEGFIDLYGIHFEAGTDSILSASDPTLNALAELMRRAPDARYLLVGHTASGGDETDHQRLSERQVQAVIRWLIGAGIVESRLDAEGRGGSEPIAAFDSESAQALNRRIELVLVE
ncbi:MAG: OmpA family protein [Pseudomonadota bacterium]